MAKKHKGLGIGFGLAAIAAATAGAYFFYSKNAAKNRKQLKAWMVKAKAEVMERLEKTSDLSQKTYEKVVDEVMKKYRGLKKTAPKEVAELSAELKRHWSSIRKELEKATRRK
jgi:uncharacterized protein YoxC